MDKLYHFFWTQNLCWFPISLRRKSHPKSFKWYKSPLSSPAHDFCNSSDLSPCFFPPCLLCCSYNFLQSLPLVLWAHSCPRAFAPAVPSTCNASLQRTSWLASFRGLSSAVTLSESPSLTSSYKIATLLSEFSVSLLHFILRGIVTISYIFIGLLIYLLFLGKDFVLFIAISLATRQVSGT